MSSTKLGKGRAHDLAVFLANRPLQFGTLKVSKLFGDSVYIPRVGYIVNNAETAKTILADTEHFSSGGKGGLGYMTTALVGHMHALINTQGQEHTELKNDLRQLFSKDFVANIVDDAMSDAVADLVKTIKSGQAVDLADYIKRCTSLMTAHMIGLGMDSHRDRAKLRSIADTVNQITQYLSVSKIDLTPAELTDARKHYSILGSVIKQGYNAQDRPDSVIAHLRALGIEYDQAQSIITVMLVAGTETVSSSFPRIMALLLDSGSWNKLCADPSLLQSAIDEGLRYVSPAPVVLHGSIADTFVDGKHYRKDRRVILALHNILHDKRYSQKPAIFDITRKQSPAIKNLWFGNGPHMCLGFFLAQKELSVTFAALMEVGNLKITKRRIARNTSFPGYSELWVKQA